jgi:hypothetical protein
MGMRVNKSWCDDRTFGVDLTTTAADVVSDGDNQIVLNGDIDSTRGSSRPVVYDTVSNYEISGQEEGAFI